MIRVITREPNAFPFQTKPVPLSPPPLSPPRQISGPLHTGSFSPHKSHTSHTPTASPFPPKPRGDAPVRSTLPLPKHSLPPRPPAAVCVINPISSRDPAASGTSHMDKHLRQNATDVSIESSSGPAVDDYSILDLCDFGEPFGVADTQRTTPVL
jgi:hypothetical protein